MNPPLVAVDIGNSRIKLGLFQNFSLDQFPQPVATVTVSPGDWPSHLGNLFPEHSIDQAQWWIGSVNRHGLQGLLDQLRSNQGHVKPQILDHTQFPIQAKVDFPEKVGIDRLAAAVAVDWLRKKSGAAIAVDVGSAITIDWVSSAGVFHGGAILPGIGMSARALHHFTDQLPHLPLEDLTQIDSAGTPASASAQPEKQLPTSSGLPSPLGRNTTDAIRSGLYWGAIGAMKELILQLQHEMQEPAQVYLTGGAAPKVAALLGAHVDHHPHLVLAGIALTALNARHSP